MSEPAEFEFDSAVVPGGVVTAVALKTMEKPLPNSGIPSYPETALTTQFVSDKPFKPLYIEVLEGVNAFDIEECFVGQRLVWAQHTAQKVAASIIHARPAIDFPVLLPGCNMTLRIRNTAGGAQTFRAKVVGEFVELPPAPHGEFLTAAQLEKFREK